MTDIRLPEPFPRWSHIVAIVAVALFALEHISPILDSLSTVYYGAAVAYLMFTKRYRLAPEGGMLNLAASTFVFLACWWVFWLAARSPR